MCFGRIFHKLFVEHPQSVGETYIQHGSVACGYGATLVAYGIAEFVHAVVPGIDLFQLMGTTSEECLENMVYSLNERKSKIE